MAKDGPGAGVARLAGAYWLQGEDGDCAQCGELFGFCGLAGAAEVAVQKERAGRRAGVLAEWMARVRVVIVPVAAVVVACAMVAVVL
ncbi:MULTISPECIES: hypothetical protein [unclassified Streptomyces]|jgi:hypothetical protein|uniref:hypothetical protein n=1 Tax=unclassified Streptomyces TaxID=2593676 RepID=UPI0024739D0D|nr:MULTISPECIES: hypothetical protein [unclassified Streptomyces]MDH6554720.1 hypothetical protein [Streptomyces sp. SAI-041]